MLPGTRKHTQARTDSAMHDEDVTQLMSRIGVCMWVAAGLNEHRVGSWLVLYVTACAVWRAVLGRGVPCARVLL